MCSDNRHRQKPKVDNGLYIAWWKVENLFDTRSSRKRPAWLKRALSSDLEGWDHRVLSKKLARLAEVIRGMNDGRGPDLLGVCEVENEPVLRKLLKVIALKGRDYDIAHHETSDKRGIDVAFIYDRNILQAGDQFSHVIQKRSATRDLFQVNFRVKATGQELIAIGNHWPARMGGQRDSEPYRMMAGETLSYWLERITEIKGEHAPVLVMGDFNDQLSDPSLTHYANSTRSKLKVQNSTTVPRLYNLMWTLAATEKGTYYNSSTPLILDQFLATKGLLTSEGGLKINPKSAHIIEHPPMVKNKYGAPRRFGRPSTRLDEEGYSDHWAVGVRVMRNPIGKDHQDGSYK